MADAGRNAQTNPTLARGLQPARFFGCSGRAVGIDPDPAGAQQWCGVRLGHFHSVVGGDGAADAGQQRDLPDAGRGAEADMRTRRLRAAKLFGALVV